MPGSQGADGSYDKDRLSIRYTGKLSKCLMEAGVYRASEGDCARQDPLNPPINEAEFEEIMSRNRTVSSSAIARAVADASAGKCFPLLDPSLESTLSLLGGSHHLEASPQEEWRPPPFFPPHSWHLHTIAFFLGCKRCESIAIKECNPVTVVSLFIAQTAN
ncbi:hypothetical protein HPB48_009487 [Haemaphysalis longicornis]|uniref:CPSF6/7 RSLD domain-containing protein n=1 Tax=Haemaphysalis longicornis TaxID=44386 RepID=A0A9J6GDH0_HAELO|nr:hypothetical protein HPB48_009487 [Haemaphysalis longicornis]